MLKLRNRQNQVQMSETSAPLAQLDLVHDLVYNTSMIVNIHEAKTHFSRLVEQACGGEEIVIARAGVPLLRLVRLEGAGKTRTPGLSKGKIAISADFDAALNESILREFET